MKRINLIDRTLQLIGRKDSAKLQPHKASEFEQELISRLWEMFMTFRGFTLPDGEVFLIRSEAPDTRGYVLTLDILNPNVGFQSQLLDITVEYESPDIVPRQVKAISILFSNYLARYEAKYYDHNIKIAGRSVDEVVEEVADWTAKYMQPIFEAHGIRGAKIEPIGLECVPSEQ